MAIEYVNKTKVKLIDKLASDDMVAMAAWVSHDRDDETRLQDRNGLEKLISFLYRNDHMSPFEHGIYIFKVDVPLFVAREFQRHRTFSYNEVSGRYTQMKPRFWRADEARIQKGKPGAYYFEPANDEQTALYRREKEINLERAWVSYLRQLDAGIAKEQAREDMPLSLMTQFYATCKPRNLMDFLTLRTDKTALKEIQEVAGQMEHYFKETMPLTHKAWKAGKKTKTQVNLTIKEENPERTAELVNRVLLENSKLGTTIWVG